MSKLFKLKTFESNRFDYYYRSVILPTFHFTIRKQPSKLFNVFRAVVAKKTKKIKLKSKPFIFKIEAATGCNLQCPLCVEKKSFQPIPKEKWIRHDNYKIMHEKIKKNALRISYYIFGEPLVNPHIENIIRTASSDNIYTYFCSNFTLASNDKIERLIDAGLGEVSVPLDGWTQEQYEKYRVGGKVDNVKNGISHLMQFKKENNLRWPLLKVNTITFDHYKEDMDKIQDFCLEQNVDSYVVKPNLEYVPCNSGARPYSECFWLWYTMLIDTDGTVYPCLGQQRQKKNYYGNLLTDDLEDIWNGEKYVKMRSFLTSKNKESYCAEDVPCINCTLYN